MKKIGLYLILLAFSGSLLSCAGMKVVNPNDKNENQGTKALDLSSGKLTVVDTYSCKIVASNGQRVSAIGKSEEAARKEALAKCRDKTHVSFCDVKNLKCEKN
jgi:hypothetical protein